MHTPGPYTGNPVAHWTTWSRTCTTVALSTASQSLETMPASIPVQELQTATSRSSAAELAEDLIPPSDLRTAIDNLYLMKAGEASSELARHILRSFHKAMPELLRRGECIAIALKLPFSQHAERPVKDLLMLLARRLRRQRGCKLQSAELAGVPALLQRVGFRDNAVFDDFCVACGEVWQELDEEALSLLLRRTEDYALLHPCEGPALPRLLHAIEGAVDPMASPLTALAALCKATLDVRNRAACKSLLGRLKEAFQMHADGKQPCRDAVVTLPAIASLHAAIGIPASTLQFFLRAASQELTVDTEVVPLVRACSLCYYTEPAASTAFFDALLDLHMTRAANSPDALDTVLSECHRLPAPLRRQIAQRLQAGLDPSEFAAGLQPSVIGHWLRLVHDLPVLALAEADTSTHKALVALVAALLDRFFGASGDGAREKPLMTPSVIAAAYLVASSAVYSCRHVAAASEENSLVSETFEKFQSTALDALEIVCEQLSRHDVYTLFRSPADSDAMAHRALAFIEKVQDKEAQLALFHAAAGTLGEKAQLSRAATALQQQIAKAASTKCSSIVQVGGNIATWQNPAQRSLP